MENEKKLSNGSVFRIGQISFQEATEIKSAVMAAFLKHNINIADVDAGFLSGESLSFKDLGGVINILICLDSDPQIREKCFVALKRSTLNSVKIQPDIFDDEKNMECYYEVMFFCLQKAISPFFRGLLAKFTVPKEK